MSTYGQNQAGEYQEMPSGCLCGSGCAHYIKAILLPPNDGSQLSLPGWSPLTLLSSFLAQGYQSDWILSHRLELNEMFAVSPGGWILSLRP